MIEEKWKSVAFIVPAVAYMVILSFIPSIEAVLGGFQTRVSPFTTINYTELEQLGLSRAIVNTAIVTGLALLVQFILGFMIATVLTKSFIGKRSFSVLFLLPFGVATVVAGFVFSNIFTYTGGYANSLLTATGIYHFFGIKSVDWLSAYWNATFSLVISDSWKNTPIVALILLAGMNSISPDVYNQAYIDGAGPFSRFFRITLPNLSGFIAIALIIRGVSEFNIFAIALLLYTQFPLLTTMAYGFFNGGGTDYEAYAASTILLAFILIFAGIIIYNRSRSFKIQNGFKRKKNWFEHYRWFYTSESFLAIAGKGGFNSQRLARKYSSDEDVIIGSDEISVPFTVIESPGTRKPKDKSIKEACAFALAYTDKWDSKQEKVKFYWQLGKQGAKTPITVSYRDLELAISDISGEALPMVTPSGTMRKSSGVVIVFRPSEDQESIRIKPETANKLGMKPEGTPPGQKPGGDGSLTITRALFMSRLADLLGITRKELLRSLPSQRVEVTDISLPNTAKVLHSYTEGA